MAARGPGRDQVCAAKRAAQFVVHEVRVARARTQAPRGRGRERGRGRGSAGPLPSWVVPHVVYVGVVVVVGDVDASEVFSKIEEKMGNLKPSSQEIREYKAKKDNKYNDKITFSWGFLEFPFGLFVLWSTGTAPVQHDVENVRCAPGTARLAPPTRRLCYVL